MVANIGLAYMLDPVALDELTAVETCYLRCRSGCGCRMHTLMQEHLPRLTAADETIMISTPFGVRGKLFGTIAFGRTGQEREGKIKIQFLWKYMSKVKTNAVDGQTRWGRHGELVSGRRLRRSLRSTLTSLDNPHQLERNLGKRTRTKNEGLEDNPGLHANADPVCEP